MKRLSCIFALALSAACGGGVPILMYHSVAPSGDPLTVSETQLDAQLDYLARAGFKTVSLKEMLDAQDGHGSLPEHPIVLTFDDGFAEHYATVLPLLQKRKQKATFFIVSGWTADDAANRKVDPQVHRPHLTWTEVRALRDAGMEIGSHTVTHGRLTGLKPEALRAELEQSKADLERELKLPIEVFAYPFTSQYIRVRQAVQRAGYRAALVGPRGGADRLELQRITIRGSLTLGDFRDLLGESWATGYTTGGRLVLALLLAVASAGPLPGGDTALTVTAGRPFYSIRLDHGLSDRFDAGAGLDVSASGFVRPVLRSRLAVWAGQSARISLRAALAYVMPGLQSNGFGPRPIAHTGDGELGLNLDWSLASRLWAFAELSVLGETDGKVEHSAAFAQALGGLEWATPGPLSLLARGGVLQGSRGRAAIGSAGVAWHF